MRGNIIPIVIRKYANFNCCFNSLTYDLFFSFANCSLIRNSNGLTTIQLLRQHSENLASQQQQQSSSNTSTSALSPNGHHSLKTETDEMPTDLRKSDAYYNIK